jgi:hypothetical protein
MDRAMGAIDCEPIQVEKGRIPEKRSGEPTGMWEAMDQADSSVIDLLHRVVDNASATFGESRVHREEPVVRSCEADRLPVTLAATGEEEPIRQGGTEAVSRRVEGIGAVAFAFQRAQSSRERPLGPVWRRSPASCVKPRLRLPLWFGELHVAEETGAKLEAEVDMWLARDAEYHGFSVSNATGWEYLPSGR